MEASVGILISVKNEEKSGVMLQQRAADDSYAGALQVTAHGKLQLEELRTPGDPDFKAALIRKMRDELGSELASRIEPKLPEALVLTENSAIDGSRVVRTYGLGSDLTVAEFTSLVVPKPGVGFICHAADSAKLLALDKSFKASGVPIGEKRMFPDEIEATSIYLEKLG